MVLGDSHVTGTSHAFLMASKQEKRDTREGSVQHCSVFEFVVVVLLGTAVDMLAIVASSKVKDRTIIQSMTQVTTGTV